MSFAYPFLLLALIIPLLLIIHQWRSHARTLPLPFDHQSTTHSKWLAILLNIINTLPALVLAIVIILIAGPRKFERPENKRKLTNIQICLDVSGSMTAEFGTGDRYDAAMESLNEFLSYRKGDAFSLMVFGDDNLRWVPLTTDVSAFKYAPPYLHPDKLPRWFSGGTAIGKALKQSEKYLTYATEGDRLIILISDGQSSDLYGGRDVKVAQSLKDNNIQVYTIHIGQGNTPPDVEIISSITEGATFSAGDPESLEIIFRRIDEMTQAPLERLTPDPVDNFRPYSLTALSICGVFLLTLFGLRYTPW